MNPIQRRAEWHRQRRSERQQRRREAAVASTIYIPEAAVASTIYIPDDLIKEVISFLPVKSLIRLKCVSKPFNSFITDYTFIKMHLKESSRNTDLTFVNAQRNIRGRSVKSVSFTVVRLLDNPPIMITLPNDPYDQLNGMYAECRDVIGSCNGLLCLLYRSSDRETWFRVWNPATKKISDKLGSCDCVGLPFNFTFGYDSSKDTFKVVRFLPKTTKVRVFGLNNNIWRNIQNSPVAHNHRPKKMKVVHFGDSVNWLVICNYSDADEDNYDDYCENISIEQFVIISLDLRTETHTKLLPPQGFNEVPIVVPNLSVLNGCLCFSHDFELTDFIIWQMTEFGVENSWTQFLKISYVNLQRKISYSEVDFRLFPLCLSKKNDTVLLTNEHEGRAILYNWRDHTARRINKPSWFKYDCKDYVESLFSYC